VLRNRSRVRKTRRATTATRRHHLTLENVVNILNALQHSIQLIRNTAADPPAPSA
jgi:non-homologous end joining protein Ku